MAGGWRGGATAVVVNLVATAGDLTARAVVDFVVNDVVGCVGRQRALLRDVDAGSGRGTGHCRGTGRSGCDVVSMRAPVTADGAAALAAALAAADRVVHAVCRSRHRRRLLPPGRRDRDPAGNSGHHPEPGKAAGCGRRRERGSRSAHRQPAPGPVRGDRQCHRPIGCRSQRSVAAASPGSGAGFNGAPSAGQNTRVSIVFRASSGRSPLLSATALAGILGDGLRDPS